MTDRLARKLPALVAAVIVAIGLPTVLVAAWKSTFASLGRDQGIYQYVAWAMAHGERDYLDIRELNGPLIHMIHRVFLRLGGADEHVFRTLDLWAGSVVFLAVGWLLPGIAGRADSGTPRPSRAVRALFSAAAWVVLTSQYLSYDWWQSAQRESFYNLFLLLSVALQLFAQERAARSVAPRRDGMLFALAGALSAATWFGKPTCIVYALLQAGALAIDRESGLSRRTALASFVAGCALMAGAMLAYIAVVGDLASFARVGLGEMPREYRYIWKLPFGACCTTPENVLRVELGVGTVAGLILALGLGVLPLRCALLLVLPVGGLITFFVQEKGFPYHLHPVTAGTHVAWLAVAACAAERVLASHKRAVSAIGVVAAALAIAIWSERQSAHSDAASHDWFTVGYTAEARASERYLAQFALPDYRLWDLRRSAAFVRANTDPSARVQTYGMDPYFLFLAGRLSATPFIYGFELNVDAALQGAPDAAEREWLLANAQRHDRSLSEDLARRPPAAFVLFDRAPFLYPADAETDLAQHAPHTAAVLNQAYRRAAQFGTVRVWLRSDLPIHDSVDHAP
jgi:hypothetical protein